MGHPEAGLRMWDAPEAPCRVAKNSSYDNIIFHDPLRPGLGSGGKIETMKKKKQEPAWQELDYSKLELWQLEACEAQLKALAKSSGYPAMKSEYQRRLAEIRQAKEQAGD